MGSDYKVDTRTQEEVFPDLKVDVCVTGNKVLVQLKRASLKSKGGLILASETVSNQKYDEVIAKVVQLGPLAFHSRSEDGFLIPWAEGPWCQVGDLVRTIKYGGDRWSVPYEDDFIHYIIVHDREIIARIPSFETIRTMVSFF